MTSYNCNHVINNEIFNTYYNKEKNIHEFPILYKLNKGGKKTFWKIYVNVYYNKMYFIGRKSPRDQCHKPITIIFEICFKQKTFLERTNSY